MINASCKGDEISFRESEGRDVDAAQLNGSGVVGQDRKMLVTATGNKRLRSRRADHQEKKGKCLSTLDQREDCVQMIAVRSCEILR